MSKNISITDCALNSGRFDRPAFYRDTGRKITELLAKDNYETWAEIQALLKDPRCVDYGFEYIDITDFTEKFFAYTNERDDRRSDAILDAAQRGDSRFVDAHAYKMQAFNEAERAVLKNVLRVTGAQPQHFVHVGCGGTLETMLNIRDGFADDGMPLKSLTGLDKRAEVLKKGQDIADAIGLDDFAVMDADRFAPEAGESAIFCFAAYLFPDKSAVIQNYLDQLDSPAILMVRNMSGPFGKISPEASLGDNAQLIATSQNKDFSVDTAFYHYTPA